MVRLLAALSRLAPRPLLAMQKINSNAQDQTYVSHRNRFIECACLDGAPSHQCWCTLRRRVLLFAMRPMASLHPYARFAPALCAMSVPAMRYVHAMPYLCTTAGMLGVQYRANLARQPRNYCAENLISPVHSISPPKVGCFFSAKDGEHATRKLAGQGREIWIGNDNGQKAT